MKKVYLNDRIADSAYQRLAKHVEIVKDFDHPEELDAIIVRQQYCTGDIISRAKKCRVIQQHGTGLDRIDVTAAKEFGIPVYNTPGVNARSVAEHAIMLMLALSRKANVINRKVHAGELRSFGLPETVGLEMFGKRLGIVGSGNIAQITADIARSGFNMEIYCYSEHSPGEKLTKLGYQAVPSLEALFETCDYVSLHNLLSPDTYHMINSEIISHAKKGLILVNTARGALIDEEALFDGLKSGLIGAAGLDVFEKEPPETTNPLLSLDNVIATMHVAGSTYEALERNGKAVVDNVFRILEINET